MAINDVSLTAGMRSNLLNLQNTVSLLERTQSRLSSGNKVNTAIDNPTSFFASQALNARAAIIDSLKDAMGQAIQTVTAADKGIKAISTMIEQAKGIAQSALSVELGSTPAAIADGDVTLGTITYSSATVDVIGTFTNGQTVIIGTNTFTATAGASGTDGLTFSSEATLVVAINSNLTLGWSAAIVDGKVNVTRTGADVLVADITVGNALFATKAAGAEHAETWSITANGTMYTATGGGVDAAAAKTGVAAALQTALRAGADVATATVASTGKANVTFDFAPTAELVALEAQYDVMRAQIDTVALDSGYKGKNLLDSATLSVKFEGTHKLDVVGFDASTAVAGLNITAAATNWVSASTIDASVTALDSALEKLRAKSSTLAGNLSVITVRQDFSTSMMNTLTEGANKLTMADANEEGANMLMLQTRQSLSTTALSLSAQAAQSVLRLFQ